MATTGVLIPTPCVHAQASQTHDYSAIDRHALSTPDETEHSIATLAEYLTKPAHDDQEKARAIYRWIAENIAYDMRSFRAAKSGNSTERNPSAASILQSRGALCSGYARLFESLAAAAGLKVAVIDGCAKGLGYTVGSQVTESCGHQWNAVSIDGKWRLIDCAWGAGYVDGQDRSVSEFDDHFFLTPPEEFIYDHFPTDSKWQLLDKPISRDEFESLPFVRSAFFRTGMKLASHTQSIIKADDSVAVTFSAPADVRIIATLVQGGHASRTRAIAQREDGVYKVYAALPKPGKYILQVYAKRADDHGKYSSAVDYLIEAGKGAGDESEFPVTYGAFNEGNGRLYQPMEGHLKAGGVYPFRVEVPGAEEVSIISGEDWVALTKYGDIFEGKVAAGSGTIKVAAKYPGEKNYAVLLEYQADEQTSALTPALSLTAQ